MTTMKVGKRKKASNLCQVGTKIILAKERKKMTTMRIEGKNKQRKGLRRARQEVNERRKIIARRIKGKNKRKKRVKRRV